MRPNREIIADHTTFVFLCFWSDVSPCLWWEMFSSKSVFRLNISCNLSIVLAMSSFVGSFRQVLFLLAMSTSPVPSAETPSTCYDVQLGAEREWAESEWQSEWAEREGSNEHCRVTRVRKMRDWAEWVEWVYPSECQGRSANRILCFPIRIVLLWIFSNLLWIFC